jgi:NAD-dependent DNA ligase
VQKIEIPTECPACGGPVRRVTDQLYCIGTQCGAKAQKQIEHFAKTLRIKGLGPASIEKLQLQSILDIYELSEDVLVSVLGKVGSKLWQEIEASKEANLEDLIPALGIPLIGKTAAKKLIPHIDSLSDLSEEVVLKSGLGPTACDNLISWLELEYPYLEGLPIRAKKSKTTARNTVKICITGKLSTFKTKSEAEKALVELGYEVVPNLTKEVAILVNESGVETSKTEKARNSGVTIVTDLEKFIYEST